jgi:hypothetical protein
MTGHDTGLRDDTSADGDRFLLRPYIQDAAEQPAAPGAWLPPGRVMPQAAAALGPLPGAGPPAGTGSAPAPGRWRWWWLAGGSALAVVASMTALTLLDRDAAGPARFSAPPAGPAAPAGTGSLGDDAPLMAPAEVAPSAGRTASAAPTSRAPADRPPGAPPALPPVVPTGSAVPPPSRATEATTGSTTAPSTAPATAAPRPTAARVGIVAGAGGRCLDSVAGVAVIGSPLTAAGCNGTLSQRWSLPTDGTLRAGGSCAEAAGDGSVHLALCGSADAAQWRAGPGGSLVNLRDGRCLDAPGDGAAPGTPVRLTACDEKAAQRWALP